jgi:hypothetical protein
MSELNVEDDINEIVTFIQEKPKSFISLKK